MPAVPALAVRRACTECWYDPEWVVQAMWGAAGEVKALRSVIKRVAASELEIAAEEAAEAATYWDDMVCPSFRLLCKSCTTPTSRPCDVMGDGAHPQSPLI